VDGTEPTSPRRVDGVAAQTASAAQHAIVGITINLKELELLAAQIELSANCATADADNAMTDATDTIRLLDAASQEVLFSEAKLSFKTDHCKTPTCL